MSSNYNAGNYGQIGQGMMGGPNMQSNMQTGQQIVAPQPQGTPGGQLPGVPQTGSDFQGMMPLLLASAMAQGVQGGGGAGKSNKGAALGQGVGAAAGLAIGAALAPATGGMSMLIPMMGMSAGGAAGGGIGGLFD